jgi:ribulose-5-phosphate 4-epimerase/fuculose-1-phosphate aldolase
MTITAPTLSPTAAQFVEELSVTASRVLRGFRETGTTTAYGTVGIYERVPGEEILVLINDAGPFGSDEPLRSAVVGFDGTVYLGPPRAGGAVNRYRRIFEGHDDITTVVHVHSPHLGAWAQTHRTLPINYVPVQRFHLVRELPVYVDRTQPEDEFILGVLAEDPAHFATLEANGGSTVWGRKGLLDTAEDIVLLEEGARLQILAEAIGGSEPFGPGVLAQQFNMSGLTEQAKRRGLLP